MNANETYFNKNILQRLGLDYDVELRENGSYTLEHPKYGIIDIFPKRQRLLIRSGNKWVSNGFKWIENNLITEK